MTEAVCAPEPRRAVHDRRLHPRVDVQIETQLLGNSLSGLPGFSTHTLDVSAGGVRIAVPEELPLGLELFLMLHLPGGEPYTARARVLRSSPWDAGESGPWAALAFTDPSPALQAAIRAMVDGSR